MVGLCSLVGDRSLNSTRVISLTKQGLAVPSTWTQAKKPLAFLLTFAVSWRPF